MTYNIICEMTTVWVDSELASKSVDVVYKSLPTQLTSLLNLKSNSNPKSQTFLILIWGSFVSMKLLPGKSLSVLFLSPRFVI